MPDPNEPLRNRLAADGFVALPQFFDHRERTELLANVCRFVSEVVPELPAEQVFYERLGDRTTLKQIQQMALHDRWFEQLCSSGRLRALAEQLLSGPVVQRNVQYLDKPPGIGKPTPPHQDGHYFMIEPCDALTMWLALDDVDDGNGCVHYVRGSHRHGLRPHARTDTLGFSQGIVDYPRAGDTLAEVACPAAAGDLLVHHALTIHRADGNRTADRRRRALGLIYYGQQARVDGEAHAAYQHELARRMKAEGKIAT